MKLQIDHITKKYGSFVALDNVSLVLEEGIYGLLGPNGAGKTTLMNILTDNLSKDGGEILYDGKKWSLQGKNIGFMPQSETIYPFFTGLQYLYYIAALKEMDKTKAKKEIRFLLKKVGLWDDRHKKAGAYSGGMKRRLMLAGAMLNHPDVLILDEPTAGMDPEQRVTVRNLIGEMALSSIVILSTHVVSDIEYIAREIIVMDHGHVLYQEKPHVLRALLNDKVFFVHIKDEELSTLEQYGIITAVSREEHGVMARIITDHALPFETKPAEPSLEDVYQYLFQEKEQ